MEDNNALFVGLDVSKDRHAVAVAESGRNGEVRYLGEISSDNASVGRLVRNFARLRFCYEAGPTGYGLKREIETLGHECAVIAPSLIPHKPGDRIKNKPPGCREACPLVPCRRTDEIWTPDAAHEAMRDLIRAREAAVKDRTRKRQEIRSFLLRHGKIFPA
ncbi:hypothetical protein [Bradyrhizobium sp. DASA03120]|uniref:hypothetical protein n=1 Tax=Bradyrhizobium sp. SMVTL-02 TaxID=3395917 RepID=UPI003F6FB941